MSTFITGIRYTLFIFICTALLNCAGTDGSGFNRGNQTTPTPQPNDLTKGKIEAIHEQPPGITVNDVQYSTDENTAIFLNGKPQPFDQLEINQVVTIKSQIDNGNTAQALQINYLSSVIGPIERFNSESNEVELLGQSYLIDENTLIFDEASNPIPASSLTVNTLVEVSALDSDNGFSTATRIDIREDADVFSIFGVIESIRAQDNELEVNQLVVNYSNASISDETREALDVGVEIFVIGLPDMDSNEPYFNAQDLAIADDEGNIALNMLFTNGEIIEFESPSNFVIDGGYQLAVTEQTLFTNGDASDLSLGDNILINAISENQEQHYQVTTLEFKSQNIPTAIPLHLLPPISPLSSNQTFAQIYAPLEAINSQFDSQTDNRRLQILSQSYPVEDVASINNNELIVNDWYKFEINDDSEQELPSILQVSQSDSLKGFVLIGTVEKHEDHWQMLNQNITLTSETQCYLENGNLIPCQEISTEGPIYVEGRLDTYPIQAQIIVELMAHSNLAAKALLK